MAGFKFSTDVNSALRRITGLEESFTGRGLQDAGEYLVLQILESSTQSFNKQADPSTGEKWAPLKYKRARGSKSSARILLDTGRLRRAVRASWRVLGEGKIEAFGGTIPLDYAAIHQFGGTIVQGMREGKHLLGLTGSRFVSRRAAMKAGAYRSRRVLFGMRSITIPARPYVGLEPARYERIKQYIAVARRAS